MEQKKLLEEAEKKKAAALVGVDGGAKTPDEPSAGFSGSKSEPKTKKRKLDDEISLPNSDSEFTLDGDGVDEGHDAQAKATNEWLSKYLSGTVTSDDPWTSIITRTENLFDVSYLWGENVRY